MDIGFVLSLAFIALLVIAGRWRMTELKKTRFTENEYVDFAQIVLRYLYSAVGEPDEFRAVAPELRQELGVNDIEFGSICRVMWDARLVKVPSDWGLIQQMLDPVPRSLALTKKAWGEITNAQNMNGIIIGDGNGPINIGGYQIAISGQDLDADDLIALIDVLREDSMRLPELQRADAEAAADILEKVLNGELDEKSPDVHTAIEWIKTKVSAAVDNAAGNALWAGTIAVARTLGWV